jgi:putative tryptophan/tyrosine transport system substrate-binding protein
MASHIGRRKFLATLGGAATWPLAAGAQQPDQVRRIGVLMSVPENDSEAQAWLGMFSEGLQQLGWTAGRNIRLDYRWAAPFDAESRQRVGKELIALQPELILTQNTVSTASILQETRSIPIIFASGWSCSKRLHRASTGSPSCSNRQPRHMPNIIWTSSKPLPHPLE